MRNGMVRFLCALTFVVLISPLAPARASDMKQDYIVCSATPDGPGKQDCMKKLQPKYKSKAFSVKACDVRFWVEDFVAIDDYLKIHDADYEKALKMLQIMTQAKAVADQNGGQTYQAFYAEAGYYNSLGPEWKRWSDSCKELAKFVMLNPQR